MSTESRANDLVAQPGIPARTITPVSPIDLRPLAPVRSATAPDVALAVRRAREAHQGWKARPLDERVGAMKRAARALLRRRDEGMRLCRDEMGKLPIEGLFNETLGPITVLGAWADLVRRLCSDERIGLNVIAYPGKRARVQRVPRGVVGVIAPWNFPIAGLYRSVFPALLTGNGLVLKPSEYTPRSSAWLIEVLAAELPDGLAAVVQGDATAGAALIDAGVDACVFTGSVAGGAAVARRCAERGIPSSIEMGGKDCAIVLADCDPERTAAGLTHWALSNAGQSCGAIEVALVEERIADRLVEQLRFAFARVRAADEEFAEVGPLANRRQLDVVEAQVADARARGAIVACGGAPTGQGLFYQPTLLDHCNEEMAVVTEETFGPLLAVVRVAGASEAVSFVNRARYGLGASIWSRDVARAERIAERLDVGIVDINNHSFTGSIPDLPWSGTRATGFGVANGEHALATFVRPRAIVVDAHASPDPFWMPFDRALWDLGQTLADAQLLRLGGAWRLPLLLRARVQTIRRFFGV